MSKTNQKLIATIIIVLILLAGGAYYLQMQKAPTPAPDGITTAESAATPAPEATTAVDMDTPLPPVVDYDEAKAPQWVKDALKERSLGSETAPVVVEDFSSLTCPHCAQANEGSVQQLKKEYVDTGKVRFVMRDFPLNVPALQAAALARCISDNEAYFAFIDQLFRTQSQWGETANAKPALLANLKFTGLSREDALKCLNEPMLYAGILKQMDEAKTAYKIESTPTFIINEGKAKVRGAQSFEEFKNAIDPLLKQ